MISRYRISVDHHSTYGIDGKGKYGLAIIRADTGVSAGPAKELFSAKELQDALGSLGYSAQETAVVLEVLTDRKAYWSEMRNFDESAVTALGF